MSPPPGHARAASGTAGSATRAGTATTATRAPRKGSGPPPGEDAKVAGRLQQRAHTKGNRALASSLNARPLTSRPLVNPHLRSDPRLRVRITRSIVAVVCFVGFTIGLNWRIGLTAAVIYIAADSIFRSRTTVVVPAGVRITSAQRFTRRRLRVLQPAGYLALARAHHSRHQARHRPRRRRTGGRLHARLPATGPQAPAARDRRNALPRQGQHGAEVRARHARVAARRQLDRGRTRAARAGASRDGHVRAEHSLGDHEVQGRRRIRRQPHRHVLPRARPRRSPSTGSAPARSRWCWLPGSPPTGAWPPLPA